METLTGGGISMICKRYNEANNKLLKSYNANKPTSYTIYFVADDLYGHSMRQLLPTEILDLANPKGFNLDSYYDDIPIG